MSELDSLEDGEYTAVIDTIDEGLATVFFEQGNEEVADAVIDVAELPAEARHADAILQVEVSSGELVEATYDSEKTKMRGEQAQDRFDRLSSRPPDESS